LSELDEAMKEHMAYIVLSENRPPCFRDFLCFEVDGKEYRMKASTFRNKISRLRKSGDVELDYNSGTAFYTLKGYNFGKPMTPTHAGGKSLSNDSFVRMVQNLPLDKNALHDIRLRFEVKNIWKYLSTYHSELSIRQSSNDVLIPTWNFDDLLVRVTVHRTDTVSISIGCTLAPVIVDVNGVIRLSVALARVEERLNELLKNAGSDKAGRHPNPTNVIVDDIANGKTGQQQRSQVPDHRQWIVTMWHFGADSLTEYSRAMFHMSWEVGRDSLVRAYTKIMRDKKIRIRLERQEYPNKSLLEAIQEKLDAGVGRS
jgi:hypothetical protein